MSNEGKEWDWVDKQEEKNKEERDKGYFHIQEGDNRFVLLSHCAPLAQVYASGKYRAAEEGDTGVSIKGVCWIFQEGLVKEAKLPYTVVKGIRALQQNPDWEFVLPFPHVITLNAKGAGTTEVKYTFTASPKTIEIPAEILNELKKKPSPEEVVERIKGGKSTNKVNEDTHSEYPEEEINPDDIPF